MNIKVRDAIKAIKNSSFLDDQNVEQIEIETLNTTKLEDTLNTKFVDVKFIESFRKPLERKLQVEYSYADGERIAEIKEDVDCISSYIRLNKFEAFETIVNSKEKVVNWKNANSITSYYQKLMTARFGREYAAELFSYCNNQIEKRADVISQIDSAFEKGLEIVTLTQGKQQKLFFTKGDEKLLKAYRKKLATEAKEYQKYINDIQYFIDSEYKDNEKVD